MTPLTRLPDWEERLSAWLSECAGASFEWGKLDCLMFAAGAIKAVTGHDPAKGHRGEYNSLASSVRYLKKLGADSPWEYLDNTFPSTPKAFARRGDLVLAEGNVGVCFGGYALFVGIENEEPGLIRIPFAEWQAAWAIG